MFAKGEPPSGRWDSDEDCLTDFSGVGIKPEALDTTVLLHFDDALKSYTEPFFVLSVPRYLPGTKQTNLLSVILLQQQSVGMVRMFEENSRLGNIFETQLLGLLMVPDSQQCVSD